MAISKNFLKSKPICKITFTIPSNNATKAVVVGDFNNWDPSATPLKKQKNGVFKGTIDVETGKSYEFKYIVDGVYYNDPEVEEKVFNSFANDYNSVVTV